MARPFSKSRGKEKEVRFSLTKEQRLYVKNVTELRNRIAIVREYIGLWMEFFRFFAEDLSQKEITGQEEKAFFQVMTTLARKQFLFAEMTGDTFDRGNDIINVLSAAVSVANIQAMNENTRSKLELDWHNLFLDMNRALGRLVRRLPGEMTLSEALGSLEKVQALSGPDPAAVASADGSRKK